MRTRITKIVRALCMTVLCAMLPMQMAFAAGDLSVSIPVEISLEGTLPEKAEEFVVEMAADDVTYPMPEGSKDGICTMTLTGAESMKFPVIRYDNLGIYTYTITQKPGTNPKCTYDTTKYELTVYVTNAEDGDGMEVTAVLYPEGELDKLAGVSFENVYEIEPVPQERPKTGDESNAMYYLSLIGISAVVIVMIYVGIRKKAEK